MKLGSAIGAGTPTEGAGGGSGAASVDIAMMGQDGSAIKKAIIRWPSLVDKHSYGNIIYIWISTIYLNISIYCNDG